MVARYLDCGIFERGFARIRCPDCATEFLLAFSCKGRGLCPSCGAKRAAEFAAFLRDEVVADVGHAQWVFTVPKLLRPYFMHHRELLGPLCAAAWQTVRELMAVPVSLARLRWVPGSETATYLPQTGHDGEKAETLEALDFVARLLAHVPDPRRHVVHYYGATSNVVRGKLKARGQGQQAEPLAPRPGEDAPPPPSAQPACASPSLAALRRGWAQLLRRVYETDPLVCPHCQAVMRVVAFITEGRVIRRILDHLGASALRAPQDRAPPPAAAALPVSP